VLANNSPNFLIHATLASATPSSDAEEESDAKTALMIAKALFIAVMRAQSALFNLSLENDLDICGNDLADAQAQELRGRL
jgi:hypothetical protein